MNNTDLNSVFSNTADSIREKRGIQDRIEPKNFAEEIGKISGGEGLDDNTVVEYLENKLNNLVFPESLADGDILIDSSGYLINTNLSITKESQGDAYVSSSTNMNPNFQIENVSNKDYLISYDNLKFKLLKSNQTDSFNETIENTFTFNPNKLNAYDISSLEKDIYRAEYELEDGKTSIIYIEAIPINNSYYISYSYKPQELANHEFVDGMNINLFMLGELPLSSTHLTGCPIYLSGDEPVTFYTTTIPSSSISNYLFSYIVEEWSPEPSYKITNNMSVHKYSEDDGDFTIQVNPQYKFLTNIEQDSEKLEVLGFYLKDNYDTIYAVFKRNISPLDNIDINVDYYINNVLTSHVSLNGTNIWDDIVEFAIQRSDFEIDYSEDNYKFIITIPSSSDAMKMNYQFTYIDPDNNIEELITDAGISVTLDGNEIIPVNGIYTLDIGPSYSIHIPETDRYDEINETFVTANMGYEDGGSYVRYVWPKQ